MLVTIPVRKATSNHKSIILDICRQNHEENGQFNLDMGKVEATVDRALHNEGAIGIVGKPDKIEGAILLSIGQFWYTKEYCLEEVFNYVLPEYRKSTHAKDMIKFAIRCSDEIPLPLVIGVVSNERTRAKLELYKRQLGDPVGGYFLHRPMGLALQSSM